MTTNASNQEKALTSEQYNKKQVNHHTDAVELAVETDKMNDQATNINTIKKIRIRMIPIWLRLVIIAVLLVLSLLLGAIVGYGVIGDGHISDVFKKATWTHITDLILK